MKFKQVNPEIKDLTADTFSLSARYNQSKLVFSSNNIPSSFYSKFVPLALGASIKYDYNEALLRVLEIDPTIVDKNSKFKSTVEGLINKNGITAQNMHMLGLIEGRNGVDVYGKTEDVWAVIRSKNQALENARKCSEWIKGFREVGLVTKDKSAISAKRVRMKGCLATAKCLSKALEGNKAEEYMLQARDGYLQLAEETRGETSIVNRAKAYLIEQKLGLPERKHNFFMLTKLNALSLVSANPEVDFYTAACNFVANKADKKETINAFDNISSHDISKTGERAINEAFLPEI